MGGTRRWDEGNYAWWHDDNGPLWMHHKGPRDVNVSWAVSLLFFFAFFSILMFLGANYDAPPPLVRKHEVGVDSYFFSCFFTVSSFERCTLDSCHVTTYDNHRPLARKREVGWFFFLFSLWTAIVKEHNVYIKNNLFARRQIRYDKVARLLLRQSHYLLMIWKRWQGPRTPAKTCRIRLYQTSNRPDPACQP